MAGQFDVVFRDTWRYTNAQKLPCILLGQDWSVDRGAGARKLRESDFLSLSGIPANQCREFSHGVLSSIYSPATLPIAVFDVGTCSRAPASSRLPSQSVARARRHIGNSVSTIIPRTIRKTRAARCDRSLESRCTRHPGYAIRGDIRISKEKEGEG